MRKLTCTEFIEKASFVHSDKFDYSQVQYKTTLDKIIIICKIHGQFLQAPNDHLKGSGCPSCSGNKKLTSFEFIVKASTIHKNKYTYEKTAYINNDIKVIITCCQHGDFTQIPNHHLNGSGCPICGINSSYLKRKKNLDQFIVDANLIHHNKYDYSKSDYKRAHCIITIICKKHGSFSQRASTHLDGQGCPKCGFSISKAERKWLDSLNIQDKYRQKSITINGKRYRVDAFDLTTNTIYEFYGDYWHGNPSIYDPLDINKHNKKKFKELFEVTINREKIYKDNGFNVVSIWESDFKISDKQ